jgi:hypothetical protein
VRAKATRSKKILRANPDTEILTESQRGLPWNARKDEVPSPETERALALQPELNHPRNDRNDQHLLFVRRIFHNQFNHKHRQHQRLTRDNAESEDTGPRVHQNHDKQSGFVSVLRRLFSDEYTQKASDSPKYSEKTPLPLPNSKGEAEIL